MMMLTVAAALCVIAMLYASVGHGGASGYLAVLALADYPPDQVRATALLLNVLVSSVALRRFARGAKVRWNVLIRFASSAAPCALLAGSFGALDQRAFHIGVSLVLLFAAWRMALPATEASMAEVRAAPGFLVALPIGACIGVVSGLIGVGGGIFLSPLLLIGRWATPRETAAISAAFILLSSVAGLIGVAIQYRTLPIDPESVAVFAVAALIGGWIGASLGAGRFSGIMLRRALAVVLLLAAIKLAMKTIA